VAPRPRAQSKGKKRGRREEKSGVLTLLFVAEAEQQHHHHTVTVESWAKMRPSGTYTESRLRNSQQLLSVSQTTHDRYTSVLFQLRKLKHTHPLDHI
jgi:hypothetical protein